MSEYSAAFCCCGAPADNPCCACTPLSSLQIQWTGSIVVRSTARCDCIYAGVPPLGSVFQNALLSDVVIGPLVISTTVTIGCNLARIEMPYEIPIQQWERNGFLECSRRSQFTNSAAIVLSGSPPSRLCPQQSPPIERWLVFLEIAPGLSLTFRKDGVRSCAPNSIPFLSASVPLSGECDNLSSFARVGEWVIDPGTIEIIGPSAP